MNFSVCIPVFNRKTKNLVEELKSQISTNNFSADIILIDDASEEIFRVENQKLAGENVRYFQLEKNVGRSEIRNHFPPKSQKDFLLFLDCDGKIVSPNFLQNYVEFIKENPNAKVVYGGRTVPKEIPDNEHILRWKFANERENSPISERKNKPYKTFQTNNFLVERKILETVKFDANLKKYGYEDVLFAIDLKRQNIPIFHIENPVLNDDVETNGEYLKKVEESAINIAKIAERKDAQQEIRLLKTIAFVKKFGLEMAILYYFKKNKYRLREQLIKKPNLRLLDFYKLGACLEAELRL